ncbi:GNAT family N-acetyltransferase [Prauserella endophytica]|uniref:GNAT family N-acetyltransferase n=1 Tax=Prauserella endophytica TaxID=1592324 RepID=A0ABY2RUU4_9PSEU|nr:GNAT family N-acetyltransferase [Prauserella endophytica]TKG61504.1 GNAT family N-acetyltransferase [Prauserella endophytica]
MFDSAGQFGRAVPVLPQLRYELTARGGLREHHPAHCPRQHPVGSGTVWVGWNARLRLRQLTCRACHAHDPAISTWCIVDPGYQQRRAEQTDGLGVEIVAIPPEHHPAGVGRIEIRLNGRAVGDIDLALCAQCQAGIIEHIRVDPPPHRRRGFGRVLLAAALSRGRGYRWSTTAIEDTDSAHQFWKAVSDPALRLGLPERCPDMRAAASLQE